MAEEEIVAPALTWPGEEPLETDLSFALDGTTDLSFALDGTGEIPFSSVGRNEDWGVVLPSTSDRVCSEYENYVFPMHDVTPRFPKIAI